MKWIKENDRKVNLEDQGEKMAFLWWDKEYDKWIKEVIRHSYF